MTTTTTHISSGTSSKAAKQVLSLAEQFAPDQALIMICEPTGQVLTLNKNFRYIQQKTNTGITNLAEIIPDENKSAFFAAVKNLSGKNRMQLLLNNLYGSELPFLLTCSCLKYNQSIFLCCILTEEAPRERQLPAAPVGADYKAIFENSLDCICILDVEGRVLDLNQAAQQIINLPENKIAGEELGTVLEFSPFEKNLFRKRLREVLQGEEVKFDWWLKDQKKELMAAEIILKLAEFSGKQVILAQAVDLSNRITAEHHIRSRNSQLEFVNHLLTHLAIFETNEEILKYTLEQLLDKTHVIGGGIYMYQEASNQVNLLFASGTNSELLMQYPEVPLRPDIAEQISRHKILKTKEALRYDFNQVLPLDNKVLMPVCSDQGLTSVLVLFLHNSRKKNASLVSLIESIGNGIGQYITQHNLNLQLRFSEIKYKNLFDSATDAIILSDGSSIIDGNQAVKTLTGYAIDKILNKDLLAFLSKGQPTEVNKIRHYFEKALAIGKPVVFEWKIKSSRTTPKEAEITFNRLLIENNFYVQTIIRDITQKKQAQLAQRKEEVLRESISQFRDFVSKVEMAYLSVDTEGNIKYLNHYMLHLLGYEKDELIGKNYFDFLVPEGQREIRRAGFLKTMEQRVIKIQYEKQLKTKTGQIKTLIWQRMFDYDADGNMCGMISLGKDVSDKKAAMEALKDNKSRLQDIFDNSQDLIQNISIDNKFIFVNKAWKEKLGYDDFDIEKLSLNDIVHPYYKAKLIYQLRNLYKGENVNKIETVFLTKSGKPVHLIGSINCTYQKGVPVASRAILHDITDRIKAERLQKVYYSIANLAISSKDLKSLFGAIHRELSKIIETNNIFIALTDENKTHLNFAYFVDQFKRNDQFEGTQPFTKGIPEYIINTGKSLFLLKEDILHLEHEGLVELKGAIPEVILCSPLSVGDRIIGVIAVQDYRKQDAYVSSDIEILHFISNQVALAIERKRNEVQINTQNARLKAIFDSGSHLMWSVNRQGSLTSFNQNFALEYQKRTGILPEINETYLLAPKDAAYYPELYTWGRNYEAVFTGKSQHFEIKLTSPDQAEEWQEIFMNPIYLEDGSFEEISALSLDITETKLSQLALKENEEKFRSIFESFQDVFFRTNAAGHITLISPSVYEVLGYTAQEVIGMHVNTFFADINDHQVLLNKLASKDRVQNFDARFIDKNLLGKDMLINASFMLDKEGNKIGIEAVAHDITELKKIQLELIRAKELAESSSHAKTQFLANMSHELRTPMNGIIGMIDLLYHTVSNEEQLEYVDTLRKSSDALLDILNDILDLSKIQAGKLELNEAGMDLHYTLEKIHSLFINRANQKDLEFTYHITPHTPHFIVSDETRLQQILSNLTSNAIKFTNAGRVEIFINSISTDEEFHTIMFRVKDSGIGIMEEDKKLLFTNFTQLDNSSTKTFGGTGLGLAISKQLSELLGGEIGLNSVYGQGSTFWFTIKCKAALNEAEILEQRKNQAQSNEVQRFVKTLEVLLVDDNAINQKVAEKLLLRLGCDVQLASNGYEAIEKATSHQYDLIFMDIQMPEMDGVTATGKIKAILGDKCPPIIAMTAYSMKDDAEKFLSQGMDDYVSKPVKANHLHAAIKRWIVDDAPENLEFLEEDKENSDIFIDETVIEQLRELGGNDFAQQLYLEFEEETEPLLQEAATEVAAKNYDNILGTLHQIKGTASTLGIYPVSEMAKKIEHDFKQQVYQHADEDFAIFLEHFKTFKKLYPKKFTQN